MFRLSKTELRHSKKLSDMIGKEKVIWRFDPLIITPNIAPRDLLNAQFGTLEIKTEKVTQISLYSVSLM